MDSATDYLLFIHPDDYDYSKALINCVSSDEDDEGEASDVEDFFGFSDWGDDMDYYLKLADDFYEKPFPMEVCDYQQKKVLFSLCADYNSTAYDDLKDKICDYIGYKVKKEGGASQFGLGAFRLVDAHGEPFARTDVVKNRRVYVKLLLRGGGKRNMEVVKRDMKNYRTKLQTSLTASKCVASILKPVEEMNKMVEPFGSQIEANARQAFTTISDTMTDKGLASAIALLDKSNTKASETKKQELSQFMFGTTFNDVVSARDAINSSYESARTVVQYGFGCAVVQDNTFDFGTLKSIFEHQISKRAGAREAMASKGQGKGAYAGDVQTG